MNSIVKTLELRVADFLNKYGLLHNAAILVAFSGGPDSTALLHILHVLSKQKNLDLHISAVYVNHNLRSDSEIQKEISHIQRFANNLHIDLHILECPKGKIEEIALQRCRGIEDAAREARYTNIFTLMDSCSYSVLATAHTLDDQVETMLMRFLQGSGPEGLLGIRESNRSVLRPLLGTRKEELLNYLKHYNITTSIDSTNLEIRFLRNKIRKIIPGILDIFPGLYSTLPHGQEKLEMLIDHLKKESQGDHFKKLLQKASDNVSCKIDDYLTLDSYQRTQLIYKAWELLYQKKSISIPFTTIKPLILADENLFRNTGEYSHDHLSVSKRILEFAGTSIYTDRNRLFWFDNIVHTKKNRYLRVEAGNNLELFSGCTLVIKSKDDVEKSDIVFADDLITRPVIVRSLIPSDEIELTEGRKQVSKLLKDWKIPSERRWMIPVIEDRKGITAVLGKAFGGSNRIASRMKIAKDSHKIKNLIRVNVKYTGSYSEYGE
ncbi:MAG: tRNA lysidine(34) synthetase TilS [Bacteroidetes bacterium]|nr:tRNA lysidine(34) synthetase TilS [Bacteroidota bacterium]